MSSATPSNVCEHGHLRRKCPHCENAQLERDLAAMTARAEAAERDAAWDAQNTELERLLNELLEVA